MKFRLGRTSIAWLATSLVMYGFAAYFTVLITAAEGGTLERGLADDGNLDPWLTLGVYVDEPSPDLTDQYEVTYDEDSNGETGRIFFDVPANSRPTILIGRLTSLRACDGEDFDGPPSKRQFTIEEFGDRVGDPIYRIIPMPSSERTTVICDIFVGSRRDTFTTRLMNVVSYTPLFSLEEEADFPRNDKPGELRELTASRLAPLQPITLKLKLPHIPGARSMRFMSDDPVEDSERGETWRLIRPAEFVLVGWDDEYQRQQRDILLIVIGTLIGIGVTVMIEGFRPAIERLGNAEPGSPRRRGKLAEWPVREAAASEQKPPPEGPAGQANSP